MTDHLSAAVANNGLILQVESGSTLYGTDTADSDTDLRGICIEPPSVVLGLRTFEGWKFRQDKNGIHIPEGEKTPPGSIEGQVFSLRRWTKLVINGDLPLLIPLWAPLEKIWYADDFGVDVIYMREKFLSKRIIHSSRGYLENQRKRLLLGPTEYDYDTKSAYHALRIAAQATELLRDHTLTLPMLRADRGFLLEVRAGEVAITTVLAVLDQLLANLDIAASATTLPDKVDESEIDKWLYKTQLDYWKAAKWLS